MASSDIFYLAPEHRRGTAGIRLLAEAEKNVIAAAQRQREQFKFLIIVNKEKTHFQRGGRQIVGAILRRQGYSMFEHHHHKRIDLSTDIVGAQP